MVLETTIEGDSSKVEEKAAPMEVSSGIVNSWPTKRKAEEESNGEIGESSDDEEESKDENEESSDEEEEESEEEIDMLKPPEWDVDSFDGLEYYSSEEVEADPSFDGDEYSCDGYSDDDEEALQHYSIYKRQIIESHGFYADPKLRPSCYYNGIRPEEDLDYVGYKGKTYREYWGEMANVCLQKYNQEKDLNVEFVELVRAFYRPPPRSKTYITFMARENPDEPPVEYQAKFMHTFDGKKHPILCRPAPPTPKP